MKKSKWQLFLEGLIIPNESDSRKSAYFSFPSYSSGFRNRISKKWWSLLPFVGWIPPVLGMAAHNFGISHTADPRMFSWMGLLINICNGVFVGLILLALLGNCLLLLKLAKDKTVGVVVALVVLFLFIAHWYLSQPYDSVDGANRILSIVAYVFLITGAVSMELFTWYAIGCSLLGRLSKEMDEEQASA